ncbi:MAG: hypothetical protein FWH10_08745 [Oscillospiraceae bacterium]|nr:hypothetical protein [Oscillospiraceae bacterium]
MFAAAASDSDLKSADSFARLISIDRTTRGNWPGNYGSEGYAIISGNPAHRKIPAYAAIDFESDWGGLPMFYTWWDQDDGDDYDSIRREPGALFKTPEKTSRIAACYYSGGFFTVIVDVGREAKILSLYMHDYDEHSRSANVVILDENGRELIDYIEVSGYESGWYLRFQISGVVQFMIEDTSPNGMNACLSGVFFDPGDPGIIIPGINDSQTENIILNQDSDSEFSFDFFPDERFNENEASGVFDGEFIMALSLLGIIYIVFLLGAATLTSRIADKFKLFKKAP